MKAVFSIDNARWFGKWVLFSLFGGLWAKFDFLNFLNTEIGGGGGGGGWTRITTSDGHVTNVTSGSPVTVTSSSRHLKVERGVYTPTTANGFFTFFLLLCFIWLCIITVSLPMRNLDSSNATVTRIVIYFVYVSYILNLLTVLFHQLRWFKRWKCLPAGFCFLLICLGLTVLYNFFLIRYLSDTGLQLFFPFSHFAEPLFVS
ncbi:MAG: hypothetical protein GY765_14810 [bacterium]|nr:hypothetical protein [bacterium]